MNIFLWDSALTYIPFTIRWDVDLTWIGSIHHSIVDEVWISTIFYKSIYSLIITILDMSTYICIYKIRAYKKIVGFIFQLYIIQFYLINYKSLVPFLSKSSNQTSTNIISVSNTTTALWFCCGVGFNGLCCVRLWFDLIFLVNLWFLPS